MLQAAVPLFDACPGPLLAIGDNFPSRHLAQMLGFDIYKYTTVGDLPIGCGQIARITTSTRPATIDDRA